MRRKKARSNFDYKLNKKGKAFCSMKFGSGQFCQLSLNKAGGKLKWRLIIGLYSDITESYRPYAFSKLQLPKPLFTWFCNLITT